MPPPGRGRPRKRCLDCAPQRKPAKAPAGYRPQASGALVDAVRRDLDAAGRLDTPAGLSAVALAERIASGQDPGAGLAQLVKQLGTTMADALRNASVEGDAVDELRQRRDARAAQ